MKDWHRSSIGRTGSVAAILGVTLAMAGPAAAGAAPDIVQRDSKRDAHSALDVVRVTVSHDDDSVKVVVRVRDYVPIRSAGKVATAIGVHFDTSGDRRPDHRIQFEDESILAGSTWDWNAPDPIDPSGHWLDCEPDGWDKNLVRPRPDVSSIVFNAPRSCLQEPDDIRVAVQSYRPARSGVGSDWLVGTRRYTPWVSLR